MHRLSVDDDVFCLTEINDIRYKNALLKRNIIKMSVITQVLIYLDKEAPEYMDGIYRIGGVDLEDEKRSEKSCDDLVDNSEFHNFDELKKHVVNYLVLMKRLFKLWIRFLSKIKYACIK